MAWAFRSVTTVDFDTGSLGSETFTAPSGMAAGDLLVACIHDSDGANAVPDTLSGWTASTVTTGVADVKIQYKIATSADVTAGSFTFTGSRYLSGSVAAFTGAPSTIGVAFDDATGGASNNQTGGTISESVTSKTPSSDGSLLIMFAFVDACANPSSVSGWSINGTSPTWTELHDFDLVDSTNQVHAAAYAIQSTSAAINTLTANYTASGSGTDDEGILLAIFTPQEDVTASVTPLILNSTVPDASVSGNANVTATPLIANSTIPDATVDEGTKRWTGQTKNNTSWIGENKS